MWSTRRAFLTSALCVAGIAAAPAAFADGGHATPEQAQALAKKAAAYVKEVGADKAFAAFTNDAAWHDGELFVYAYNFKGICVANGGVQKLVGVDMSQAKDPITGSEIVTVQIGIAKDKGEGWHEYHFSNPASKKIEKKKTYLIRVGGDFYLGVGAYIAN